MKLEILKIIVLLLVIIIGLIIPVYSESGQDVYIHDYDLIQYYEFPESTDNIMDKQYLDIPLSEEIQDYIRELSLEYDVPFELLIAIMETESNFQSDLISSTNDYGIMQINKVNHKWLKEELGITDFLDTKQSILCGTYIISGLYHKYDGDLHKSLTAYNRGEGGMRKVWKKGTRSTSYSRKVVDKYENY